MAKKRKKKNRLVRNIIIVVVVLLVIITLVFLLRGKEETTQIFTETAKKVQIIETVSASGKIQPETEVKISPDVSGEIVDVYVEEGDSVVKDQLLLRIRPDNFQASVDNARATVNSNRAGYAQSESLLAQREAQLVRAKQEYDRQKQLFDDGVISEADFQLAETNYRVAQQDVESAKQAVESSGYGIQSAQANLQQNLDNLSRTEIYAPATGTISKLSVEKGEKVVGTAQMAGTEMLIIANLNNMEVQVDVNETDIVRVRLGQKADIEVDAYPERKFQGVVTEIANTANATVSDDAVTEFKVKVRILNESYQDLIESGSSLSPFRPGMTASVDIITEVKESVLSVPLASVTTRGNEKPAEEEEETKPDNEEKKEKEEIKQVVFLYDEKEGKVKMQEIKTGISDFNNIEVLSGIEEGVELVAGPYATLSSNEKLKDGDIVEKVSKEDLSKNKRGR